MHFFQQNLSILGYSPIDLSKKIWKQNEKTVVICLVDDITSCIKNSDLPVSLLFDSNTTVITDNIIHCPTQYRVLQLPNSFYGIYYYQPELVEFNPVKRFNLSINRIDNVRLSIFLELAKRSEKNNIIFCDDYVNFNCVNHEQLTANAVFEKVYNQFYDDIKSQYNEYYNLVNHKMPYCNHNLSHEQSMTSSLINLIVETYSGQEISSVSEKMFRALITPAPWTLYGGRYTVGVLKSLGFDTLDDLVDHDYNYRNYDNIVGTPNSKVVQYIWKSISNYNQLATLDQCTVKDRCINSARSNQRLLLSMRQRWPKDFATWWNSVIDLL
jgi:hypothetical protein